MSRMRRAVDLLAGLSGVVLFGLPMLVIAAAVWSDDRAPVLFRQPRVGLRRRPFTVLKFRTMRDGRITRVGRVLRATGLDEIPQFVNILRGDMGIVGPRPLTPDDVERLGWAGRAFDFRWAVKPGLTGLAQLAGPPQPSDALALDRFYLAHGSARLDAVLIGLSFVVNACGKTRVRAIVNRYVVGQGAYASEGTAGTATRS